MNRLFEELAVRMPAMNFGGDIYLHRFPASFGTAFLKRDLFLNSGIGPLLFKLDSYALVRAVSAFRADIYHTSHYRLPECGNCGKVVTVYDMEPEKYGSGAQSRAVSEIMKLKRDAIERSDRVIAVSGSVRRDVSEVYGVSADKISVVYPGAGEAFYPASDEEKDALRAKYGLKNPFILFTGERGGKKNFKTLYNAFSRSRINRELDLVCVGSRWNDAEIGAISRDCLGDRVRFFEYQNDSELRAFYCLAETFVCCSRYESFCAHLVDAMACGAPVIAASTSSLPELAADAAQYFDPDSEKELVSALERVAGDKKLKAAMSTKALARRSNFNWEKTAAETYDVYKYLLHG